MLTLAAVAPGLGLVIALVVFFAACFLRSWAQTQPIPAAGILFANLFFILAAVIAIVSLGSMVFRFLLKGFTFLKSAEHRSSDAHVPRHFENNTLPPPETARLAGYTHPASRVSRQAVRPSQPAPGSTSAHAPKAVKTILSKGENAFYLPLVDAVAGRCVINSKMRLADLIQFDRNDRRHRDDFVKASRLHVDFVLVDPANSRPLLVIELDDKTHHRHDRMVRDVFVDRMMRNANLPLRRVRNQMAYDIEELRGLVNGHLPTHLR